MVTIRQILGADLCTLCGLKPARRNDSRCHKCASPTRYGETGNARSAQARRYRKICADRIAKGHCEFCGQPSPRLEVDHINGIHADDRPENFQVLCPMCHTLKSRLHGDYRQH